MILILFTDSNITTDNIINYITRYNDITTDNIIIISII